MQIFTRVEQISQKNAINETIMQPDNGVEQPSEEFVEASIYQCIRTDSNKRRTDNTTLLPDTTLSTEQIGVFVNPMITAYRFTVPTYNKD